MPHRPGGQLLGPLTQTINLVTAAPSGCAATLTGSKVDGSAAPGGKTATANITAAIAGCSVTPAEIFLTSSAITCSATSPVSWIPFVSSLPFALTGPQGLNYVRGCVPDAAHNVGSLTQGTITLDTQPPAAPGVLIDTGALYVNAAQVTLRGGNIASVSGTAAGALEWAIGESPLPSSFTSFTVNPQNFTFAGDGPRTIYAVFRDDVGNARLRCRPPSTSTSRPRPARPSRGRSPTGCPRASYTSSTSVSLLTRATLVRLLRGERDPPDFDRRLRAANGQGVRTRLSGTATPRV